ETTDRVLAERRLLTLQALSVVAEDETATVVPALLSTTGRNDADISFAVLYRVDRAGALARLVGTTGLAVGHPAAPAECSLTGDSAWSPGLATVAATCQPYQLDDLAEAGLGSLTCGRWPEPVRQARLLPIAAGDDPAAFALVLGISARKELDDAYLNFIGLVAAQYAAAIARGLRREQERERIRQLAELDRTKTTFLAGVSHELRTPLTLILGPMESLLRDPRIQADLLGQLSTAHRNAIRLRKLVDSLLDFSRLQAGRMEFRPEPTDLAELTAISVSAFHSMAETAGLKLTYQQAGPAIAEVDRGLWDKIVLNLVSNAIKYTNAGSVTIRVGSVGGRVVLSVTDTGIGIAAANLPLIFERFQRVDGATGRSVEGVGIGLALVADFVRLHGGELSVRSEPDQGTCFEVNLPASTAGSVRALALDGALADPFVAEVRGWIDAGLPVAGGSGTPAATDSPPARLLVVDDNSDMREYLARTLGGLGTVELAVDGFDALERVAISRPDLIISDVMMPRLDGISMLRALRADKRFVEVPVIM
ncbi:MAG: hybrid sensor histidine kinase/response regulator, partial [Jatrophihabitantaceae bacterium]